MVTADGPRKSGVCVDMLINAYTEHYIRARTQLSAASDADSRASATSDVSKWTLMIMCARLSPFGGDYDDDTLKHNMRRIMGLLSVEMPDEDVAYTMRIVRAAYRAVDSGSFMNAGTCSSECTSNRCTDD